MQTRKPDVSILTQLASPWNGINSAAQLASDPDYQARRVMGSGPFVFGAHVKGSNWTGCRNRDDFRPRLSYLDGFGANIVTSTALVNALQGWQVQAEFRGIPPTERDRLRRAMGDAITFQESVRLTMFQLLLDTRKKPFDAPPCQPRAHPGTRLLGWLATNGAADDRGSEGRPAPPRLLFGPARHRAGGAAGLWPGHGGQPRRGPRRLRESGQEKPTFTLMNQFVPDLSTDRSASNFADNTDCRLDELYVPQLRAPCSTARREAVREFERIAIREGYVLPLFWERRITPLATEVRGFVQTPSHFIGQDLARLWLAR